MILTTDTQTSLRSIYGTHKTDCVNMNTSKPGGISVSTSLHNHNDVPNLKHLNIDEANEPKLPQMHPVATPSPDIPIALAVPDAKTAIATPVAFFAPTVVCDGSTYDIKKPYLHATLWNHVVHPITNDELGFDVSSNRIISSVSLHDRCGFLVCSERHEAALQNLGYQVVRWGQTMAFPMCEDKIKSMGTGEVYSGALTCHSFTEPVSLHNRTIVSSGAITGDGSFDGLNHLSGAYIPVALALQCATDGETHVNLGTKNSGVNLQTHNIDLVVGGNFTSLTFTDGTGGSVMKDKILIPCKGFAGNDHNPLVIGAKQIRPGFDALIQEMSGPPTSYISELGVKVSTTIGKGIFANYSKRLELDIRQFATQKMALTKQMTSCPTAGSVDTQDTIQIEMNELSPLLQTSYCTASMVGMQQPYPIGAPTVVVDSAAVTNGDTVANDVLASYGDTFSTNCFALESHFDMVAGRDIHPFFGISAVTHALILGQISTKELESIVSPFAKADSNFLPCKNLSCSCHENDCSTSSTMPTALDKSGTHVEGAVSQKIGRMLYGVSQNIALSNSIKSLKPVRTDKCDTSRIDVVTPIPFTAENTKCIAAKNFCGTCRCNECSNTTKLLRFTQLVTSCTHAFQKCDNYVSDQTACSIDSKGVLKYMGTESMLPFMTITKSIMMKTGPGGPDDIQTRIGMNTDDCENCAFQGRSILGTLLSGSACVPGEHFHNSPLNQVGNPVGTASTYTISTSTAKSINPNTAKYEETLRRMRIGNLSKQDQRRILLAAEVIGQNVVCNLGYFVTGSPSQSNDSVHTASVADFTKGTTSASTVYASENSTSTQIQIPIDTESNLDLFGSKTPGQRISQGMTTNAASGGLSGHCTTTLSVLRNDGYMHMDIVENTGYVIMGTGDIPCEISHRGTLSSGPADNSDATASKIGRFNGPITLENAVDVTMKGHLSTHVQTIASGLQVPGANMRPSMFMGKSMDVDGNMDSFYKQIVCTGGNQFVQVDSNGCLQPGACVKKMVNQKVFKVVPLKTAILGEKDVVESIGTAQIAMVQVVDQTNSEYKKFGEDCSRFRQAMAPPRASIQLQDTAMLGQLGSPTSLKVNFPDTLALDTKYGDSCRTFFVTHVCVDDSPRGRAKVLETLTAMIKHKNTQFINVRFANPIVTPSGELLSLYKIFGVPKDIM